MHAFSICTTALGKRPLSHSTSYNIQITRTLYYIILCYIVLFIYFRLVVYIVTCTVLIFCIKARYSWLFIYQNCFTQDHFWQPKPRPGPLLVAKTPRTTFGKVGPVLVAIICPRTTYGCQNWSGRTGFGQDHFSHDSTMAGIGGCTLLSLMYSCKQAMIIRSTRTLPMLVLRMSIWRLADC